MNSKTRSIVMMGGLMLLAVLPPAPASANLNDAWTRVQQALHEPDPQTITERVEALKQSAIEVDARRLTPYAKTLVAWGGSHQNELGLTVVELAQNLDPLLPSAPFLRAQLLWQKGSYFGALSSFGKGWVCTIKDHDTRRELLASFISWLTLAIGLSLLVVVFLQTIRHLRLVAHDAYELGMLLFQRANALIFATVVLTLPLFAGLGPIWLLAYVFALSWPYLPQGQRLVAGGICLLMMLVSPLQTIWQDTAMQTSPTVERVVTMLDERRVDLSTLREFDEMRTRLDASTTYHLLLGELLRMHGDLIRADQEFQAARQADENNVNALIFAGNIASENGNMKGAISLYNDAKEVNPRNPFVHINLSYAYDQDTQFRVGREAREEALRLLPEGTKPNQVGLRGSLDRIRYPRLGRDDVSRMRAELPPESRQVLGEADSAGPWSAFLNPLTAIFAFSILLGCATVLLRSKWMWTGQACAKCGKVFCPRCKSATESASYCSQCISVFLKRDEVAMEQQQAKLVQIQRWKSLTAWGQRMTAMLFPGGGLVLNGKLWQGALLGFGGWLCLTGLVVWAPLYLPSIEPSVAALPVQVFFGLLFMTLWVVSVTLAWSRR